MKKNKTKMIFSVFAIFAIALIGSVGFASAYQGYNKDTKYDSKMHDLKTAVFENKDYEGWQDLMDQKGHHKRVLQIINEDNFNEFVRAHNAVIAGDYETANEIRSELGLGQGFHGLRENKENWKRNSKNCMRN